MAPADSESAKALQLELAQMPDALQMAYRDSAPNVICAYAYELAGAVNRFYHETRILAEPDKQKQAGYLALIRLARRALGKSLQLRYTPELQWQEDDSIVHGAHILDILSKLDIPEDTEDETADHS